VPCFTDTKDENMITSKMKIKIKEVISGVMSDKFLIA
jgi:hypothetical protein